MASIVKALPGLMIELDLEQWGNEPGSDSELPMGDWVIYDNKLRRADDPELRDIEGLKILTPDELLIQIRKLMQGEELGMSSTMSELYQQSLKGKMKIAY